MGKSIWNQCKKKNRYRDEHAANYYKRMYERERGKKLDYYWCPYCNGYHLTSEEWRPEGYGLTACVFRLNGTACTLQREGCPLQTGSF